MGRGLFVLHVERAETHSAETLFERNAELYEVAERFGLDSYDGMDVGPAVKVNGGGSSIVYPVLAPRRDVRAVAK